MTESSDYESIQIFIGVDVGVTTDPKLTHCANLSATTCGKI